MAASDFWDYANSGMVQLEGSCNKCEDAGTRTEEAPAGAPVPIDTIVLCESCDQVVDAY